MRTVSVSAAIPEDYGDDDVFEEPESEIEYQLQVKPKLQQLNIGTTSLAMDMVAIPRKETEFHMMSLTSKSCNDIAK